MIAPRLAVLAALLLASPIVMAAEAGAEQKAGGEAGTTIVGEREAAVGLYLLPWQEENRSDIDRPPVLYRGLTEKIDAPHFVDRVASDEAEAAYRRVRLEPKL